MKKIKLWFWIILNALGMIVFFKIASVSWGYTGVTPIGGFVALSLFLILIVFLIFNLTVLIPVILYIRNNNSKNLLQTWFLVAGLWFCSIIFDYYRSPTYMESDHYQLEHQKMAL